MTGTLISDKYEIIRKIGQGGQGLVYQVRHTALNTVRALKLLPDQFADDPELVGRFQREAQVMAGLQHENIVKVLDITRDGDLCYLVEEFIDGQNLSEYLKAHGPLPVPVVLEIARQLAHALEHAHAQGVIHRDIKPSNVLVENRQPLRALLTDFGIAKVLNAADRTQTGVLLGTIKYAAPEQVGYRTGHGKAAVDGRADIYSLGLVIFEMCEAAQFFGGLEEHEIIGRLVYDRTPLTPRFSRPIPADLSAVIVRCIQRDPGQRYQRVTELLGDIQQCLNDITRPAGGPQSPASHGVSRAVSEEVSDRDLEEQIRVLEIERRRRLALAAEDKAKTARDEAALNGAPQLAPNLFQQALTQAQQATAALRSADYTQASNIFEEAVRLFAQAAAEAATMRAAQEVEQVRDQMLAAKRAAECEGAPDAAPTLFDRARQLEREAQEHGDRSAYATAQERYSAAQRLFEEAQHRAHQVRLLRTGAEEARTKMQTAQSAAVSSDAEHLAPTLLRAAQAQGARGEEDFLRGDFAAAADLFGAATDAYGRSAEQARTRRVRQRAQAEQVDAETANAAAIDAQAPRYAAATYAQAQGLHEAAQRSLDAQAHEDAIEGFRQAKACYQRAAGEAETRYREEYERQRRAAQSAESAAENARARAEQAGARAAEISLYRQALEQQQRALQSLHSGQFEHAAALFNQASRDFTAAAAEAVEAHAQQARQAMLAAKGDADAADARAHARTLYTQALRLEREAEDHHRRQACELAAEGYNAAEALFTQSRDQARVEVQRAAAETARTAMQTAAHAAAGADAERFAATLLQQAQTQGGQADAALARAEFAEAEVLYAHAAEIYGHAGEAAQRQRAREQVAAGRDQADRARSVAAQADAPRRAADAHQQSARLYEAAEAHLSAGDYPSAIASFELATAWFDRAAAEATEVATREAAAAVEREQQHRQATAARATTQAARLEADGAGAATLAPSVYDHASALERRAIAGAEGGDYETARALFEQAEASFATATATAVAARTQREAERARDASLDAKRDADLADAPEGAHDLYRRAQSAELEADRHWRSHEYAPAAQAYREAHNLYEQARDHAHAVRLRLSAENARTEMEAMQTAATAAAAPQLAAAAFAHARDLQAGAEEALASAECAAAKEHFVAAAQAYEQAATDARQERLRRQALAERENTEARQQAAARAHGSEHASRTYADAVRWQQDADDACTHHQYAQAIECFKQSAALFERAASDAVLRQRQLAEAEDRRSADASDDSLGATQALAAQPAHRSPVAPVLEGPSVRAEQTVVQHGPATTADVTESTTVLTKDRGAIGHPQDEPTNVLRFGRGSAHEEPVETLSTVFQDRTQLIAPVPEADTVGSVSLRPARSWKYARGVLLFGGVLAVTAAVALYVSRVPHRQVQSPNASQAGEFRQPTLLPPEPLAWQEISPATEEQHVKEGERLHFAAAVRASPQHENVDYRWLLDGRERARAAAWDYTPEFGEGGSIREVKVVASSGAQTLEQSWRVQIADVNRPPAITAASPTQQLVSLATGTAQVFSVVASDPDAGRGDQLTYTWVRNGKRVSSGAQPSWTLSDAGADDSEVQVIVTDSAGARAEPRTWKLAVAKPPPPPNLPPRILSERPIAGKLVTLEETDKIDFSVRAEETHRSEPLAYAWFFDGQEVGHDASWQFTAPVLKGPTTAHHVEVEVSDGAGLKAPRIAWNVEVKANPPKIVGFEPRARKVSLAEGQAGEFSITTTSRDRGALRHEWLLDGVPTRAVSVDRFQLPSTLSLGSHEVVVAAIDERGLRSAPQRWAVEIHPVNISPPPPLKAPTAVQLTEAEVRTWLARLQDAWQHKDVSTLRTLGEITNDEQEATLKRAFAAYAQLHVSFSNVAIQVDGKYATVSFDRTDSDETGKLLPHPRQSYHLEKGAGGIVNMGVRAGKQ